MESRLYLVLFLATSPAFTSVIKEDLNLCRYDEFRCDDGQCLSSYHQCDGVSDCQDKSDETRCDPGFDIPDLLQRRKRQTRCRKSQWQCRDGSCIGFDGKCDGVVDCADGSDETYPLCKNNKCQSNWFRCTYGACVDGTATCNGVSECADNSDEYQPQCFKESDEVQGQFKCQDSGLIPASDKCDGVANCKDGSDETVRACAANTCPVYLFKCAYGACVDQGSDCNGKVDCADGSDESEELCNRIGTSTGTPTKPHNNSTPVVPASNKCVLPQFPDHGKYDVNLMPEAKPGQAFDTVYLTVTCEKGYGVAGESSVYCLSGTWLGKVPVCSRFCRLDDHPSVEYRCQIPGTDGGSRLCSQYEPSDTQVIPKCRTPNYYSTAVLASMRCVDGSWDYVATCLPECGKVTPSGEQLVIGGRLAQRGELPWHAGIYKKTFTPYMQICGGSIITTSIVLSAAHCFWDNVEHLQPASRYAVAAGKLYRPWNNERDVDAQKSDVSDIKIPDRFFGVDTNFQDDIALLFLTTAFSYKTYVRPICVDFDIQFNNKQLNSGRVGKVAGWGISEENGKASQILKVTDYPYVDINECLAEAPPGFREYITSDKICAGYRNGTALCKGDSGGGLAFPEIERGSERYFLRGVVSTAPNNENNCNAYALTAFTEIIKHEYFIKKYYGWQQS